MFKTIRNFFMFQVNVEFWRDHDVVHHYGRNYADALDWARCYPNDCVINIRRFGRVIAMVGQR